MEKGLTSGIKLLGWPAKQKQILPQYNSKYARGYCSNLGGADQEGGRAQNRGASEQAKDLWACGANDASVKGPQCFEVCGASRQTRNIYNP